MAEAEQEKTLTLAEAKQKPESLYYHSNSGKSEKNTTMTAGKPIRCRAAICRGPGEPLKIEEVEVDTPKASEVRLKIICTSLCRTDITFWHSKGFLAAFPRILGHEAVGIVESVGAGVEEVVEGDTVVPTFMGSCGECEDCRSEESNMCDVGFRALPGMSDGTTSRFTGTGGEAIHNLFGMSSFVEYTVVAVTNVTKINPSMPPEMACLLSCGVSTGLGAAWKVAAVKSGSTVAIFGLGVVGLGVAEGARIRGASRIIGVDLNPDKFAIGKKFGITDFINPRDIGERPVSEVIKEMTGGGADYCFECIGSASTMTDAFESSRKGWGKTTILGADSEEFTRLSINTLEMLSGRSFTGSLFGGIKAKIDIPILVKQYLDKELHLDDFITHEVGFEDINKAFDLLIQGKSLRCIIWLLDKNIVEK